MPASLMPSRSDVAFKSPSHRTSHMWHSHIPSRITCESGVTCEQRVSQVGNLETHEFIDFGGFCLHVAT